MIEATHRITVNLDDSKAIDQPWWEIGWEKILNLICASRYRISNRNFVSFHEVGNFATCHRRHPRARVSFLLTPMIPYAKASERHVFFPSWGGGSVSSFNTDCRKLMMQVASLVFLQTKVRATIESHMHQVCSHLSNLILREAFCWISIEWIDFHSS